MAVVKGNLLAKMSMPIDPITTKTGGKTVNIIFIIQPLSQSFTTANA